MHLHHSIKLLFLKKQTGVMVILLTCPNKVPHLNGGWVTGSSEVSHGFPQSSLVSYR